MSRSGYTDDHEQWELIRWRGAVASALRGKRGQAFLRETLAALDAMPEKRLVADSFSTPDGENFCTLGVVAKSRGIDIPKELAYEPEDEDLDTHSVGNVFGLPHSLVAEIMYENDEGGRHDQTPEDRFRRMRAWVSNRIIPE